MRKPFKEQDVSLQITRLNTDGRGVGFFQKEGVPHLSKAEVLGALPGEEVIATLGAKKRSLYQAKIKTLITASPDRVIPKCPHVPLCGGCSLQHLAYASQIKRKQEYIEGLFSSFNALLHPIIPCAAPFAYRNKMEFSFSQNKEGEKFLGLILAGSKGRVFNVKECYLPSSWFAKTLDDVRLWWEKSGLQAYYMHRDEGSLRTLILREGKRTGDKMVMLTVSGNPAFALSHEQVKQFVEVVRESVPSENLSIFLRIQQAIKGSPTQFYEMHLFGPDHIKEELHLNVFSKALKLTFKISPTSFFQPNTFQAEILYSRALEMLGLENIETIFDLYCGTATLGMAASSFVKKVIGIELNPHAVFDAEANKELNQIENVEILQGDVGKVLKDLQIKPEAVIVDPPRSGLDALALSHLIALNPKKILYISCNPATQVENIKVLIEAGYCLKELQPVDQFPHTQHIENIAVLTFT